VFGGVKGGICVVRTVYERNRDRMLLPWREILIHWRGDRMQGGVGDPSDTSCVGPCRLGFIGFRYAPRQLHRDICHLEVKED
jgi:hypothetical protein